MNERLERELFNVIRRVESALQSENFTVTYELPENVRYEKELTREQYLELHLDTVANDLLEIVNGEDVEND
ncbi:hypothetical protein ETI08_03880 [Macrococcoides goetzii]|nr:hypothetical protein [Macrococcus goetzii]TDM48291.1 hypothetical protein ETI08_03880 [Macrococcus goetzii]